MPADARDRWIRGEGCMGIENEPLKLALSGCAQPLKPRERMMMKMCKPHLLFIGPQAQTNPKALAPPLRKGDYPPVFLAELRFNLQLGNLPQQGNEPIRAVRGENAVLRRYSHELSRMTKDDVCAHRSAGLTLLL